jgi:hypothetical protein
MSLIWQGCAGVPPDNEISAPHHRLEGRDVIGDLAFLER